MDTMGRAKCQIKSDQSSLLAVLSIYWIYGSSVIEHILPPSYIVLSLRQVWTYSLFPHFSCDCSVKWHVIWPFYIPALPNGTRHLRKTQSTPSPRNGVFQPIYNSKYLLWETKLCFLWTWWGNVANLCIWTVAHILILNIAVKCSQTTGFLNVWSCIHLYWLQPYETIFWFCYILIAPGSSSGKDPGLV